MPLNKVSISKKNNDVFWKEKKGRGSPFQSTISAKKEIENVLPY